MIEYIIFGGGAVVKELHLPAFKALGKDSACLVYEPNPEDAKKINLLFPKVSVISSSYNSFYGSEFDSKSIKFVLVALPNTLHTDACLKLLQNGFNVLCEKPLGLSANDCKLIKKCVEDKSKICAVGMVRRFVPSIKIIKDMLNQGQLGKINKVKVSFGCNVKDWSWNSETVLRKDQGGILVNFGVHYIDLISWIFGEIVPVDYNDDYSGGIETNCKLTGKIGFDIDFDLTLSWTHRLDNCIVIEGSKGSLNVNLDMYDLVLWLPSQSIDRSYEIKPSPYFNSGNWMPTLESCFVEQIWNFENALINKNVNNLVLPEQAIKTQEIIDWAYSKQKNIVSEPSDRPDFPSSNVVVTGGTGFVGSHLIKRLSQIGMIKIAVAVRNYGTGSIIAKYPINMVKTDLLNLESCRLAVRGARFIFHLAYDSSSNSSDNVTILGTRNILNAALLEGVESVVVFSTATVWTGSKESNIDESTSLAPSLGKYGRDKALMQKETLDFARKNSNIRVSVIAPGSVYGPGSNLFCELPFKLAKNGIFHWFENGKGTVNYIYVDNLVDMALIAASKNDISGQVFIGVDGQSDWKTFLLPLVNQFGDNFKSISKNELARSKKKSGKRTSLKEVFKSLLRCKDFKDAVRNNSLLSLAGKFFKKFFLGSSLIDNASDKISVKNLEKPQTPLWIFDIYNDSQYHFSNDKARKLLGWKPNAPLADGIKSSIEWLNSRYY